ncbi:hypothetical protein BLOT_001235 [Blomia tropicalis]|nr:hypothetical protein BLOT_001235 [Blomia tropicalis]
MAVYLCNRQQQQQQQKKGEQMNVDIEAGTSAAVVSFRCRSRGHDNSPIIIIQLLEEIKEMIQSRHIRIYRYTYPATAAF